MWTITGPWCDPRFDNVDLLLDLAKENSAVAIGVLTNPSLPSREFLELVGQVKLTADAVHQAGPKCLLGGRTPKEQAALVLATVARSKAAAETLCQFLSPAAALLLFDKTRTERFRGAAPIADAIREAVAECKYEQHEDPVSMHTLAEHMLADAQGNGYRFLPALAASCTTEEQLLEVAQNPVFGNGPIDHLPTVVVGGVRTSLDQALALATYGFESVPRAWAEVSDLGVLIAAGDPRQSPTYLRSLRVQNPNLEGELNLALTINLALMTEDPRGDLHRTLDQALDEGTPEAFETWKAASTRRIAIAEAGRSGPTGEMSTEQVDNVIEDLGRSLGPLCRVQLLLHPNAPQDAAKVLRTHDTVMMSQSLYRRVHDSLVGNPTGRPAAMYLYGLLGVPELAGPYGRARVGLQDCGRWSALSVSRNHRQEWYSEYTPYLVSQLTTVEQWREFVRAAKTEVRRALPADFLADVLERVPAPAPAGVPTASTRYEALFGNPLGDLD